MKLTIKSYDVEDITAEWAEDYFSDAPLEGDNLDNSVWSDSSTEFGATIRMTVPFSYWVGEPDEEATDLQDWLDKRFPSLYRGDNGESKDMQEHFNGWLDGAGLGDHLECVKVRFQRFPASSNEETEYTHFYVYLKELINE